MQEYICFQPTYEELKQPEPGKWAGRYAKFSAYLRGIETALQAVAQRLGQCFQPTYEELKRDLEYMTQAACVGFSAYLRGIETRPWPPGR